MNTNVQDRKLFLGPRVRRLRRDLDLSQARMAEELGISASYLNLIERNQRPVTAQLLLRLADVYDVDVRSLAGDSDEQAVIELAEVFSDPLFRDLAVPRHEMVEVASMAPGFTEALRRLYRSLADGRRREELVRRQMPDHDDPQGGWDGPIERIRDYLQEHRNHFPALDDAAEALAEELAGGGTELWTAIRDRLRERHSMLVRVMPVDVMPKSLRRFDRHRRQLLLSELLDQPGRVFAAAYHLGYTEFGSTIDAAVDRSGIEDAAAQRLLKVNLTNYSAAALVMPYGRFLKAAETVGYDIQVLEARFGCSFEQVCHRLTTLSRPSARGIPFFMVRVDSAGNVSKRYSAGRFPFSRYGGTCPIWSLHSTFRRPGRIPTQTVELPDGSRYFTVARTVTRALASWRQSECEWAVAVGCEARYASRLVYAEGLDISTGEAAPIGINCRLCERQDCAIRAVPPLSKTLVVDELNRGLAPFRFT